MAREPLIDYLKDREISFTISATAAPNNKKRNSALESKRVYHRRFE